MNVLVVGASGGTGRETVIELLARGHHVTAFARNPEGLSSSSPGLTVCVGDAMKPGDVDRAVRGQDAVVVTLGIRENALLVRLRSSKHTPLDVRSVGTRNVIDAMNKHGVRRLLVQTTYGVGDTRGRLPLIWKLMFGLILKPQINDTEEQERVVRASELDWTLLQPVALTDGPGDASAFASTTGEARSMKIDRRSIARFIADTLERNGVARSSVALSAA